MGIWGNSAAANLGFCPFGPIPDGMGYRNVAPPGAFSRYLHLCRYQWLAHRAKVISPRCGFVPTLSETDLDGNPQVADEFAVFQVKHHHPATVIRQTEVFHLKG